MVVSGGSREGREGGGRQKFEFKRMNEGEEEMNRGGGRQLRFKGWQRKDEGGEYIKVRGRREESGGLERRMKWEVERGRGKSKRRTNVFEVEGGQRGWKWRVKLKRKDAFEVEGSKGVKVKRQQRS